MFDPDSILTIAKDALAASAAEQTEVVVTASDYGLTRFANNVIHQNVAQSNVKLSLRAVNGKRIGVASSNDASPDAIRNLAERALVAAQNAEPNEDFISVPSPSERAPGCDVAPVAATVDCSPEYRAGAVREMIAVAEDNSLVAAGQFSTGHSAVAVVNSLGISGVYVDSHADTSVVLQGSDSSGWAQGESADVEQIDPEQIARTAADKALASANPASIEPGKYTVILEPLAAQDLLYSLAIYDLNGLAHQEGRTFTTGRIGEQVCGENITIWDDACDPRGKPTPFDFEGVPKQRLEIITEGILKGVPYDSYTAGREEGATNTGHALPAPNDWGPLPLNLFMQTGDHTLEDMIQATERGVLVTRFHYTNMVHPVRTVLTGMTRDGTFLVENGQIVGGLKNMRFTQSILGALSHVDMIGSEGVQIDSVWTPALRTHEFEFSSATQF